MYRYTGTVYTRYARSSYNIIAGIAPLTYAHARRINARVKS